MYRTLVAGGALAIFVLALLVVACGSDPSTTSVPATTAPPTPTTPAAAATKAPSPAPTAERTAPQTPRPRPTTSVPTVLPTPAPAVEPTPVPAAPPTTAAPTPAPTTEEPEEAGPSDAYFAIDRVLEISIEIAGEDWDTLRHQTRTFEDLMAEIEKYGLSQPFADIYTWFPGRVTVDGETHTDVGIRKKGFLGSQSDTKPSLKLRFDKYVDGQTLGGVMERMTLNNSIQDPSMVNTCLAFRIFAAAGLPSPRCNFATVSINGKDLGLYVHVEEIKPAFLARHFDSAEGNLYEGTVSDFTPEYRGTFEKMTNEDANDWSDIDAVVTALQDPSDAGLKALAAAVDLDRFLSFWAAEVLVGHWDGYAGDRNNYHFYWEPGGPFVFIPWGVDDVFHLKDDPNPFDNVSNPPPSVLALTAIPNRLYNNADWRMKYAVRLKELLDTVWTEDELLASVDRMAVIVQQHSLPESRPKAAADTERVRKFILKRKGEILADMTPEPPDWPEPSVAGQPSGWGGRFDSGEIDLRFETTWGSNKSDNPFVAGGKVTNFLLEGVEQSLDGLTATAGVASPEEAAGFRVEDPATFTVLGFLADGSIELLIVAVPMGEVAAGSTVVIGEDAEGAVLHIPAGSFEPDQIIPLITGGVEITEAGTEPGGLISGRIFGTAGWGVPEAVPGVPESGTPESGTVEVSFETAWGTNQSADPFSAGGSVSYLKFNEIEESAEGVTVVAGLAGPDEQLLLPGVEDLASVVAFGLEEDSSLTGMTIVLPVPLLIDGATLVIGKDSIAGGIWEIPLGGFELNFFLPFTEGTLVLSKAGTGPMAAIVGSFSASYGELPEREPYNPESNDDSDTVNFVTADFSLIINEVAAKGDPLDWFELYNAADSVIDLTGYVVADDLSDAAKRVAFPSGTTIAPGEYLQFELDKDGWPGFALGKDEELGIWTADGDLVGWVDWEEGQSGDGESIVRVPDISGTFQTVGNPTPGAANEPDN